MMMMLMMKMMMTVMTMMVMMIKTGGCTIFRYHHHLIPSITRSVLTYRNMERDFSGGWKVIAKNR